MAALTDLVGALVADDITDAIYGLLSSATLVVLLKKSNGEMEAEVKSKGQSTGNPNDP